MRQQRSSRPVESGEPAPPVVGPVLYAIGLDPLMVRALRADFPAGTLYEREPLRAGQVERRGPRPDAVVVDAAGCRFGSEVEAIRRAWGPEVVVVGVDRRQPYARIWRHPLLAEVVELAPGFLAPFLSNGQRAAGNAGSRVADAPG